MSCTTGRALRALVSGLLLVASSAGAAEPLGEEQLAGRWKDGDRASTIEFTRGADGLWRGTTVSAAKATEVDTVLFEHLAYDKKARQFRGTLIRPEDASRLDVTVTLRSPVTADAVVTKFFSSKTISLTRQPGATDAGTP